MKKITKIAALTLALTACGAEEENPHDHTGEYSQPQICMPSGEAYYDTNEVLDYCEENSGNILTCLGVDNDHSCEDDSLVEITGVFACPENDVEERRKFLDESIFIWGGEEPGWEFCVPGIEPQFECADMGCNKFY